MYFNPRTPRGVRPEAVLGASSVIPISIHAPLAGCDKFEPLKHKSGFISIHAPLAGCDGVLCQFCKCEKISIHAPLAGCDYHRPVDSGLFYYFNPRTPRGVRQPNFKIPTCSNTLIVSDNQYFYLFSYLLKRFIDIRRIFQVRTSLYFLNSLYFAP